MEDLTAGDVLAAHDRIVRQRNSDCRVLSEANLHQAVFNANLASGCLPRAACIFYSLCAYPAFREENAGTALAVMKVVLASGGYALAGDETGLLALAEGIFEFATEPEDIDRWLAGHVTQGLPE